MFDTNLLRIKLIIVTWNKNINAYLGYITDYQYKHFFKHPQK